MIFDALDELIFHWLTVSSRSERSVIPKASGAARNLSGLHRGQITPSSSVIFGQTGKRHVVCIEIKPHADGVRGNKKVNIAVLKQFGLRVSRSRRKPSHHYGRAASIAAD